MTTPLSNCCKALMKVNEGSEGTSFYYCTACKMACDPYISEEERKEMVSNMVELVRENKKLELENWEEELRKMTDNTFFLPHCTIGNQNILIEFIQSLLKKQEEEIKSYLTEVEDKDYECISKSDKYLILKRKEKSL